MLHFDFNEEHILENDRVRLSPLKIEHISALLDIANEPGIWRYSFVKGDGIENLTIYIQSAIKQREKQTEYPFIIFDKVKNEYAGSTRFCEINLSLDAIRLGYTWYGTDFRGTGLNKYCKYLLFEFAFEYMKTERIGMGSYAENLVSIAAMKSVGCVEEGVLRNIFPHPDGKGRSNGILLSILKEEWFRKVKTDLKNKLI